MLLSEQNEPGYSLGFSFIHVVGNQHLDLFDLSTGSVSSVTPASPSGYPYAYVIDYVEDTNGNALINWQYYNSSFTSTTSLDVLLLTVGLVQ
jgi:hypothetical protein